MPAKVKMGGSTSWGISWADVADAVQVHEAETHCRVYFRTDLAVPKVGSPARYFVVSCWADSSVRVEKPLVGFGECRLGGNRGAASMAGAYLQALLLACDDLEERRRNPLRAQETARLPGF